VWAHFYLQKYVGLILYQTEQPSLIGTTGEGRDDHLIDIILLILLGLSTFGVYLKARRGKKIQLTKQQVLPILYMTIGIIIVMIAYAVYIVT